MEIRFKIINLKTHQILLTKDFDEDEDSTPILTIVLFLEGVKVIQKLSFKNENDLDNAFEIFTNKDAQEMLDGIINLIK